MNKLVLWTRVSLNHMPAITCDLCKNDSSYAMCITNKYDQYYICKKCWLKKGEENKDLDAIPRENMQSSQ